MSTLKTDKIESLDTGRVIEVDSLLDSVTSIAAMEAYSAPVGYVFSLNDGGRSGTFDVVAGDFSTELATDTESGVYIGLADDPTASAKVAKRRFQGAASISWFGAVGDWNATAQTGTDNTEAIQAAIDFVLGNPDIRNGGIRGLYISAGNFKFTHLTLSQNSWGFFMQGAGKNVAQLFADSADAEPAIYSKLAAPRFNDLTLSGSTFPPTNDLTKKKDVFFKGKLENNAPDVDVQFNNCRLVNFNIFAQIYGRGCVITNCGLSYGGRLIYIQCDSDLVFNGGRNFENTMRHYTIRDSRFDNVSRAVYIDGAAAQKDHIHSILVEGNDFAATQRIIEGPDATIRGANISGNVSIASFAGGIVVVKGVSNCIEANNIWKNSFEASVIQTDPGLSLDFSWVVDTIDGLSLTGSVYKNLVHFVVYAKISASNVSVLGCDFPGAWEIKPTSAPTFAGVLVYCPIDIDGLIIYNNTFSSRNITPDNRLVASDTLNKTFRAGNNIAPWRWDIGTIQTFNPELLVDGTPSAGTLTTEGLCTVDDNWCYFDFYIFGVIPETSGVLTITLPYTPSALWSSYSSYAGLGDIVFYGNFEDTTQVNYVKANATSASFPSYSSATSSVTDLSVSNIKNLSNSISLIGRLKYKYA